MKFFNMTALAAVVAASALAMQPVLAEETAPAPTGVSVPGHAFSADRAQLEAQREQRRVEMAQRREAMKARMEQERVAARESMEAEHAAFAKVMEAERNAFAPVNYTGDAADWQTQQIESRKAVQEAYAEMYRLQAERFERDQRAMAEAMGVDYDTLREQKAAWEQHQAAMQKFIEEQRKAATGS
jgi:hypothetical protein